MGRYDFGQIVCASIPDGRGSTKERPAVIISDDEEYLRSGDILVVPITSQPSDPCPFYHVQVHDSKTKDPLTGLYYPSWAKCDWARWIEVRRVKSTWGYMPDEPLSMIESTFFTLHDIGFADWQ